MYPHGEAICLDLSCFKRNDMMKFPKTLALAATFAVAGLAMSSGMAIAQNVGEIATDLRSQVTNLTSLLTVIAFIVGVGLAVAGVFKFYKNTQNPNDPSASTSSAFILIFAGAALVAIPALLGVGITTVFGSGAAQTDAVQGFDRLR